MALLSLRMAVQLPVCVRSCVQYRYNIWKTDALVSADISTIHQCWRSRDLRMEWDMWREIAAKVLKKEQTNFSRIPPSFCTSPPPLLFQRSSRIQLLFRRRSDLLSPVRAELDMHMILKKKKEKSRSEAKFIWHVAKKSASFSRELTEEIRFVSGYCRPIIWVLKKHGLITGFILVSCLFF